MLRVIAALVACIAFGATAAAAQQVPIPPAPTQWVTDNAAFLSPETRAALNQKLEAYERSTGHQVIVWIGDTTGDAALEDWTIRTFEKWRIGRKGLDDGIVLFIFAKDRKIRIDVGYGLESVLPDATASEIIRNQITPRLRAGDKDGAVSAGVDAILAALSGQPQSAQPTSAATNDVVVAVGVVAFFILLVFFLIFATVLRTVLYHIPGRRYQSTPWIGFFGSGFGGGGGGGGGGFGGGFSGGGGMAGGGGASGGW
ncbi:MAG TPA: TPM domain-containing protein [Candidatus Tumulicola sp.]|nr:TPM domain-containing protein [Candidatus Tumulicola sp.]